MAFNRDNLTIVTNNVKAGVVPSVWVYYNEDYDNVVATDYFAEGRMNVGDMLYVVGSPSNPFKQYRISAKSTDTQNATAVAFAAGTIQAAGFQTITIANLYHEASLGCVFTNVVTSAANQTDTFTTSATADNFVTFSADAIYDGIKIRVASATTLPAGLLAATDYFAVNSTGNKCRLSLTLGGAPVAITSAGTGVHTATAQGNQVLLLDGVEGQRKIIKLKTDGGADMVVYPVNFKDGTIITGGDVNDSVELLFVDSEWQLVKNYGVTVS